MQAQSKHYYINVALLLSVAMGVTGCGSVYRTSDIIQTSKPYAEDWRTIRFSIQRGDYNYYINPYSYNPAAPRDSKHPKFINSITNSLYSKALDTSNETNAEIARNTLQDAIIGVAKLETKQHLADLKATQNNVNIFLGAAALGLTGGAAVAGASTAKDLAVAATGVVGVRELFNNQTYRDALVESLIGAIISDQQNLYDNYIVPKQTLPIVKYPVTAAINDAIDYNNHGSFYFGLQLIRNDINTANASRTNNASQSDALKTLGVKPPAK